MHTEGRECAHGPKESPDGALGRGRCWGGRVSSLEQGLGKEEPTGPGRGGFRGGAGGQEVPESGEALGEW